MYDVLIIGSGPAGLSAGIYGKRAGFDTIVLEKKPMSGGQILNTDEVDNYLGLPGINGFDMGMKFREHADDAGVIFENAEVTEVTDNGKYKTVKALAGGEEKTYEAKAVIIASGASHASLQVPGEDKLRGKGVSYCATCDGAFFRNRTVAVVGGGDVAVEDAVFLARFCQKVYLIHRRDSLRAAKALQNKLFACENVEIIWDTTVKEIKGEEQVEAVVLQHKQNGQEKALEIDGIFIAIGLHPNTEVFQPLAICDEKGYIEAGEECETKIPGIFAVGDVRTKFVRQIVTAAADGANVMASVEKYITFL